MSPCHNACRALRPGVAHVLRNRSLRVPLSNKRCIRVNLSRDVTVKDSSQTETYISVENDSHPDHTTVTVSAPTAPGLLTALASTFHDMGLDVSRADVNTVEHSIRDIFCVTSSGGKLTDDQAIMVRDAVHMTIKALRSSNQSSRPTFEQAHGNKNILHTIMGASSSA